MSGSSGKTCCVIGCHNSSKRLRIWKKLVCEEHSPQLKEDCPCCVPFSLHRFPGRAEAEGVRKIWIKNVNRKDFNPNNYSRVCGIHFPDGRPTKENPYPVLNMGHEHCKAPSAGKPPPKKRCLLPSTENTSCCAEPPLKDSETGVTNGLGDTLPPQQCDVGNQRAVHADHDYFSNKSTKDAKTHAGHTTTLSAFDLDDKASVFYTGLHVASFWQLLNTIMPFLPPSKMFKLAAHDQLLLVLMRLRLALMFTELGIRFGISGTTACDVFAMWRSVLANFMRDKVIFWLPRNTLRRVRPQSFVERYPKATCIINCREIFVQRPEDLEKQEKTYSNYKHHDAYKVLYCLAPNGFVMHVSTLFDGRASDAFITKNCGILSHFIHGDEILTYRRFTIGHVLPPGVKLASLAFTQHVSEHYGRGTCGLANARIHVERAIRGLERYNILSNLIPGNLKDVVDILSICAGLYNLQVPSIKAVVPKLGVRNLRGVTKVLKGGRRQKGTLHKKRKSTG